MYFFNFNMALNELATVKLQRQSCFGPFLVPPLQILLLCGCKTNINFGPITADCLLISISTGPVYD